MTKENIIEIKNAVEKKVDILHESNNDHSRYEVNKKNYSKILIHNVPFIFTCDESDKLAVKEKHSIIIEKGIIQDVLPKEKIKTKDFDLIYDAGKRGGIVITPGLINAHSHPPMYLLRSVMELDEGEDINETLAGLPEWEEKMTQNDFTISTLGDITEQQKFGITTTLSHYNYFDPVEFSAQLTRQNIINGISVASHCSTKNNPSLIEELIEKKRNSFSTLAMTVHYLSKASPEVLKQVKKIVDKHDLLFTFHMSESQEIVSQTVKKHGCREIDLLEKFGLLNSNSLMSHAIYLNKKEIEKIAKNKVGIVHLPTSNTIHKSGTFPFWDYREAGAFPQMALGTDSVVSKSRLDILTEAYQTRLTHLYSRTVKFGTLFKMMTINGAKALHLPDRGKIIPGMKADLAFWKIKDRGFIPYDTTNPFSLLGNLITHNGRIVRDLMVNGKFVIKGRRHQLVDESKLLAVLQEKHMEMRRRKK